MIVKLPLMDGESYAFVNTDSITHIVPQVAMSVYNGSGTVFGSSIGGGSYGPALGSSFPVDDACEIHFVGSERPLVIYMNADDLVAMVYGIEAVADEDRSDLMEG
jgi:hypothetical protein